MVMVPIRPKTEEGVVVEVEPVEDERDELLIVRALASSHEFVANSLHLGVICGCSHAALPCGRQQHLQVRDPRLGVRGEERRDGCPRLCRRLGFKHLDQHVLGQRIEEIPKNLLILSHP